MDSEDKVYILFTTLPSLFTFLADKRGQTVQNMDVFKPLTPRIVQAWSSIVNSEFES